jgi:hypothetical protein
MKQGRCLFRQLSIPWQAAHIISRLRFDPVSDLGFKIIRNEDADGREAGL